MRERNVNEKAINGLYISNQATRTIFKELAGMPRQDETLIEHLEKKLSKSHSEITRRDIVTLFKNLDEYGAGEFIPGRRGHPSRFRWEVDSIKVSSVDSAFPPVNQSTGVVPTFAATDSVVLITHRYQLRPDMVVTLTLPSDITPTECNRLSQFIGSLSFGSNEGPFNRPTGTQ